MSKKLAILPLIFLLVPLFFIQIASADYYANISSAQSSNQNESITFYMSQISGFNRNQVSTNCSDIRIMNASDNQVMDYFIDICNSTDIRVGFLNKYNVSGVIAKIYWNSSTATAQNKSMRMFYDDFEDGVFDDVWSNTTSCLVDNVVTEDSGYVNITTGSSPVGTCIYYWNKDNTLQYTNIYSKVRWYTDGMLNNPVGIDDSVTSDNSQYTTMSRRYNDDTAIAIDGENWNGDAVSVIGMQKDTWMWFMLSSNSSYYSGRAWNTSVNEPSSDTLTRSLGGRVGYVGFQIPNPSGSVVSFDDFQVWTVGYKPMMYATSSNLTLSSNATEEPYISITFNYSSVSFTNLTSPSVNNSAPNQLDGIYNVSVDTNTNYKVEANGTNLIKGGDSIAISNLKLDTNSTMTDISVESSVALSTSPQTIDNNIPSTNTADYHGYWLTIPVKQSSGSYSTTVTITYSNV